MRTIKISEEVWNEIAKRGKFGETEDDVLKRIFNIINTEDSNTFNLSDLLSKDLNKSKPIFLIIENMKQNVKSWTHLCEVFVNYMIEKKYLTKENIPVLSYSKKNKYFINTKKEHSNPDLDAEWRKVQNYYIDTKYNSKCHVKNLKATLEQLNIPDLSVKIKIKFHKYD